MQIAVLREIIPDGLTYDTNEQRSRSERGVPLELRYKSPLDRSVTHVWYGRVNHGRNIFNKSGVWRYREAINFLGINMQSYDECAANIVSLDGGEGANSGPFELSAAAEYAGLSAENVSFLFEGNNPSGSFKDRGLVVAATDARRRGTTRFLVASTGNTAASNAAVVANEKAGGRYSQDVEVIIIVPRGKIAADKLLQSQAYGGKIIQIRGGFDDALAISRQLRELDPTLYPVNSYNPYRIEGQKTEMFTVVEYLGYTAPDWVITPGGNLGSTAAIHKAFIDLLEWGLVSEMPRVAVINASRANTLERLYNQIGLRWNNGSLDDVRRLTEAYSQFKVEYSRKRKQHTDMSAIDIHFPAEENLLKTFRALHDMNGVVASVTDREAWDAKAVIDSNGLFMVDLASAAALAGLRKLVREGYIERDQVVAVRLTGRDKDPGLSSEHYSNPRNRFSNKPIQVANDVEAVRRVVYAN